MRLQDIAQGVGLTPRYFHKIFKDKMGTTPKEWLEIEATKERTNQDVHSSTDFDSTTHADLDFSQFLDFDQEPTEYSPCLATPSTLDIATPDYNLQCHASERPADGNGAFDSESIAGPATVGMDMDSAETEPGASRVHGALYSRFVAPTEGMGDEARSSMSKTPTAETSEDYWDGWGPTVQNFA
ncbi:hypothetical protein M011DRAFT_464691 [Sporormia fimetaria CBS 119925]|uniref:HTH araC/xylS-type domain-containing protein n=1 Tax=Sporormia fimetaria CBS 119925 TaxID=1340428 RepID=A0A6A6VL64_9PLEO|nr:hypothetical protein M011DRAFT_464691 [Sporormia fimetaria CBS 119925]